MADMTVSLDRAVDFWVCPDCDYYYRVGGVVCDCHGRSTQSRMKHVRMIPTTALPHLSPGVEKVKDWRWTLQKAVNRNAGHRCEYRVAAEAVIASMTAIIDNKQE